MRTTILLVGAVAVTAIAACATGPKVRTTVEPTADLSGLHTFNVLNPPTHKANAKPLDANDPMLQNSITNRQLRDDLAKAFQARGYSPATGATADFDIAYYAGTKEKFDTTYWGPNYDIGWRYGYRGRGGWAWPYYGPGWNGGGYYGGGASVSSYTQGQVIVDVTDPQKHELLWRGQGVEPVSQDPATYATQLQGVVTAIVAKFPQGSPAVAATSPGQ